MLASAEDTQGSDRKRIPEQPASRGVAPFLFQDFSLMRLNAAMLWNQEFPVKGCDHLRHTACTSGWFCSFPLPSPPTSPFPGFP